MEKIIITGGKGFLGRKLEELLKDKYDVFVFNRPERDITKTEDFENLYADYIIHLAAITRGQDKKEMFDINIQGTFNVLEFCKRTNAKLVFTSSAAVYGNAKSPIKEDTFLSPISFYGLTKLLGEKLCGFYNQNYNTQIVILRLFNMYGPEQQKGFVIPDIISQLKNEKIIIKNSLSKRDFVYIDDVAEAIKKSINVSSFEIINIGFGKGYSIQKLAKKIARGKIVEASLGRERDDIYANISKAKRVLDWQPQIDLDEGLNKILIKKE